MVYGDGCQSATDSFLVMEDKKLYFHDSSRTFSFELNKKELYVTTSIDKFISKLKEFFIEGKSVYVNNNLIEGTSLYYGDMLCDHFDEDNNMVNPISDVGWYLYNLFGFSFDSIQEKTSKMILQIDPVTCDLEYLDIIAQEFGLKRKPCWSDAYWRALVIYYYYNLETIQGIEYVIKRLYNYRNRKEGEEPVDVIVDGQYSSFYLSDKFEKYNMCSDKFDALEDKISSLQDEFFNIKPPWVMEDDVIEELIKMLRYGVINNEC